MKIVRVFLLASLFVLLLQAAPAQDIKLNSVTKNLGQYLSFTGIVQDKQGIIWAVGYQSGAVEAALFRYDGTQFKIFKADPQAATSIKNSPCICLYADNDNILWIGHMGDGLDRFDPATGRFSNFRHNPKDPNSLASDTVNTVINDREGNLWVGTQRGLDLMDAQTGKFRHFVCKPGNAKSISSNIISAFYVDHEGRFWIGCSGTNYVATPQPPGDGGMNLYNPASNTFTRYYPAGAGAANDNLNRVSCMYEDHNGTFWVGTQQNSLNKMDRKTGKFINLPYDPAHPDQLASLPVSKSYLKDHITFIAEDIKGGFWMGSATAGLYRYDPVARKTAHFGGFVSEGKVISRDTAGGVIQYSFVHGFTGSDGLFWTIGFPPAAIYNVNLSKTEIPFEKLDGANGNAFYQEPDGSALWIGTNKGLVRKDLVHHTEKIWSIDNPQGSGWAHDTIGNMCGDENGILWIATLGGGLCRFDPVANKATYYSYNKNNPDGINSNRARNLLIDHNHNIWVGTWGQGLDMLDVKTQKFIHYMHGKDPNTLGDDIVDYLYEDAAHTIWLGTFAGLDRLNKDGKTFSHYQLQDNMPMLPVWHIYTDSEGVMWVGAYRGLSYYDRVNDKLVPFKDPVTGDYLNEVFGILEDGQKNLWIRTGNEIIKINPKRTSLQYYGKSWGVNVDNSWITRCLKGKNDELFFGTLEGYFHFFPGEIKNITPPKVIIDGFQLDNTTIKDSKTALVRYNTKNVELAHDQNSFSVEFIAPHYNTAGEEKYRVKLENFDHVWKELGAEHSAAFFDIQPGKYNLRIQAVNVDGNWSERDLSIVINPPWWNTWWAYSLEGLLVIAGIWVIVEYRGRSLTRENRLLEQKVDQRTAELQQSLQELKAAQTQLVQSEKMASLGELTAGIAHEIQNPLNFINNFSEVNAELLCELKEEILAGRYEEVSAIAEDVIENEKKIGAHGKRADAIVKGMLQHSRAGSGLKEPTDLNALADEYMRLSYHGLRAKDKSFNAEMKTHFDPELPKVNVVGQDIGRVILNLFNNAFYAVSQKSKTAGPDYHPTVEVETFFLPLKGLGGLRVRDNGAGIPAAIKDKIMQPFFTTKPTGEGTGLGLSLTYDMVVKGHGGELKVESRENEGTEFTVVLPMGSGQ